VADGRTDQDGIMNDFLVGTFNAMKEFGQPFVSESIWSEAVLDIVARGGRSREGFQIYNELDTDGDKASKMMGHLVKALMPFSYQQLKRLDQSIKPVDVLMRGKNAEFDKYGETFEFGNEFAGLFGFRAVNVNPERTLKFKIADYQKGARNARSLFTRETLRGGPIEPREIVDAYINANRALFDVRKDMSNNINFAQTLGLNEDTTLSALGERLSNRDIGSLLENEFRPFVPSREVKEAFEENALKIGVANPYDRADEVIQNLADQMSNVSLSNVSFPIFENPLLPIMEDTPATPTSVFGTAAPNINIVNTNQGNNNVFNNLTTQQKLDLLFNRQ